MTALLIRKMTVADAPAVAEVRVRGWQFAYAGLMPQARLDAMSIARDTELRRRMLARAGDRVTNLVAQEDGGAVVGWACLGPYREDDGSTTEDGELYALYVRPERIGRGVGHALADAVLARAAEQRFPWLRLWVVEGNVRARRFYERAGFAPDGAAEPYVVDGVPVPEVRYARRLP